MKRISLICLVLALALAMSLALGCAADNRVAAKVGDHEITVQQLSNAYLSNAPYAMYYGFDTTTDEGIEGLQDYLLDSMLQSTMLLYQAEQKGITLTQEEEAEAKQTGEDEYDSFYDQFLQAAENAGATDKKAYANKLLSDTLVQNGTTLKKVKQSYLDSARENKIIEKLQTSIYDEVDLTAEAIHKLYEIELVAQKTAFDADPSAYFTYEMNAAYGYGCVPLYIPEGFIRVRHILVEDEETANAVLDKINSGEDFEALLAEYNTDPGMNDESAKDGYLVGEGTSFVQEFLEAALKLENDGDVSPITKSEHGYHIIKRVSTEPSHVIAYEDVQSTTEPYLINQAKSEHFSEVMSGWMETEGLVTRYEEIYRSIGK